ncbi:MAG: hypothetical protein QXP36_01125 [Conexivisphaerales archaeon]
MVVWVRYGSVGMSLTRAELSQRAKEIYLKAKLEEEKKQLVKLVLKELFLNDGKLIFSFTSHLSFYQKQSAKLTVRN